MRIAPKQTLTRIIPIILIPNWSQTNAPLDTCQAAAVSNFWRLFYYRYQSIVSSIAKIAPRTLLPVFLRDLGTLFTLRPYRALRSHFAGNSSSPFVALGPISSVYPGHTRDARYAGTTACRAMRGRWGLALSLRMKKRERSLICCLRYGMAT